MSEAFLCDGIRTPIGKFGGALAGVRPDDLLAHVLETLLERNPGVDWHAIDDSFFGCANQAGEDNRNVGRMAVLLAGLPERTPASTVNRLCGSGLDAIAMASRAIKAGDAELCLAGGVESMTRAPFVMPKASSAFSRDNCIYDTTIGWRFINSALKASYGVDSMPETAENVATDYGVSRADQDAFALRSQERAAAAMASGRFKKETVAVPVTLSKKAPPKIVEDDEQPRPDTTLEKLAALPTPFRAGGSVTAGNSSGVNDGAAAVIVASEKAVEKYGLQPRARIVAAATAGVAPRVMGMGPVTATQNVLRLAGLSLGDVELFELNEAFAAQSVAVLRELGLPVDGENVNPNGGAIALGHPLGMSGARLALTASIDLHERGARRAVATMCIGVGQGIAMLLERA
ncbi:MAG: 3-oxoadipyl-CoA thiolase [Candidatus Eremiobacteraeota bacterium]|nr:3-oxoadipyl-CoA thiolase [Candidatus Eremiobacteraeota bacterium]